jgi:hypothetical protein
MSHRQVYQVNGTPQLVIQLPEELRNSKELIVTIDDADGAVQEKLQALKDASSDPLYLADIDEINSEFDAIDPAVDAES